MEGGCIRLYMDEYERWLAQELDDADLRPELLSIQGLEEEIKDRFAVGLSFGTAGLRGVLGAGTNRMNVYMVRKATQGLANYLLRTPGEKSVAISYDSRIKSDVFAREAACVLAANGVKAWIYKELMPVPALSFATRFLKCDAGIMVTASHNPAKYHGYKAYGPDGCQMTEEAAGAVYEEMQSTDIFTGVKRADFDEALAQGKIAYIGQDVVDALYAAIEACAVRPGICKTAGLKLVYSPLNGSGNVPVRHVLADIGITDVTVVPEQEHPDGNFPTCPYPNPEIREALALGLALAEQTGADLMLATDPDADRVGIAVRTAGGGYQLLTGNEVGVLLLDYICAGRMEQGTMPAAPVAVKSIVSTELARPICAAYGVELFDTLTGFKFIGEKIQQFEDEKSHTFLFGFEESYGFLSSTFVRDKDGVNASLLIAEAAAYYRTKGKTLCDVMQEIFQTYGYYLEHVESTTLPGIDGLKVMGEIMSRVRENPPAEIGGVKVAHVKDYLRGTDTELATGAVAKLDYPKSDVLYFAMEGGHFVCVRPSGTEPKIKLYVNVNDRDETKAKELLQHLTEEARKLLK